MKHVSILALKDSNFASIADARAVLLKVNELLVAAKQKELFHVQIIGTNNETRISDGLFTIHAEALTEDIKKTDLIIIPALNGEMMTATHNNRFFIDWIVKQYKKKCRNSFAMYRRFHAGIFRFA